MKEDNINALIEAGDQMYGLLGLYELDARNIAPPLVQDIQAARKAWGDAAEQAAMTIGANEEG